VLLTGPAELTFCDKPIESAIYLRFMCNSWGVNWKSMCKAERLRFVSVQNDLFGIQRLVKCCDICVSHSGVAEGFSLLGREVELLVE
jgi:hypothetical protein